MVPTYSNKALIATCLPLRKPLTRHKKQKSGMTHFFSHMTPPTLITAHMNLFSKASPVHTSQTLIPTSIPIDVGAKNESLIGFTL